MSHENELKRITENLVPYRRLRLISKSADVIVANLAYTLFVIVFIEALSFFYPIGEKLSVSIILVLAAIAYSIFVLLRTPYTILDSARDADLRFNLKERISTSIEFFNREVSENLFGKLLNNAVLFSQEIVPSKGLTIENKKNIYLFASLLFILILLVNLPNGMDDYISKMKKVEKNISVVEKQLEVAKKDIERSSASSSKKEELTKKIDELLKEVKLAKSNEDLLAKLNKYEDMLKKQIPPTLKSSNFAMQSLAGSLSENKNLANLAGALSNKNKNDISKALQELASKSKSGKFSQNDRSQIAESMKNAASSMAGIGQKDLSQSLNKLANDLSAGNKSDLNESINDLENALSEMVKSGQNEDLLANLNKLMSKGKQAVSSNSNNNQNNASAMNGKSAQSSQSSSQSGKGQGGQGAQGGQGQSSNGQGKTSGQGGQGGQGGIGAKPNANAGTSGSVPNMGIVDANKQGKHGKAETIYSPNYLSGSGEKLKLDGSKHKGEETQLGKSGTSRFASNEAALLPYSDVYNEYMNFTAQAINNGEIPKGYEQLVLRYFEMINPGK